MSGVLRLIVTLLLCAFHGFASARAEGFVTVDDGTRIFYIEAGEGSPVLVAPVALYLEPLLLDDLARNRRVIMYDPRNRGRSDYAALESVSLDRQLADLEQLRAWFELESMDLLGWSGLGMEMAAYTLRHPDRVRRLIQIGAVPPAASIMREAGDARGDQLDRSAVEALDARADNGEFADAQQEYCRQRNALTDPTNFVDQSLASQVPDVCEHRNEWPDRLWPYFGALLSSFGDYDYREELAELSTPRLIIHGKEDGIPLAGANAWARDYASARLLIVSPAGHFPFLEQKDAVLPAIETFLGGSWPDDAQAVVSP